MVITKGPGQNRQIKIHTGAGRKSRLQIIRQSFGQAENSMKVFLFCYGFLGWMTCFLNMMGNRLWGTFYLIWWSCSPISRNMHKNVKGGHPDRQLSQIRTTTGCSLLVVQVATYFLLALTPHPVHFYWLGALSIPSKANNNKTKAHPEFLHPEFGCHKPPAIMT